MKKNYTILPRLWIAVYRIVAHRQNFRKNVKVFFFIAAAPSGGWDTNLKIISRDRFHQIFRLHHFRNKAGSGIPKTPGIYNSFLAVKSFFEAGILCCGQGDFSDGAQCVVYREKCIDPRFNDMLTCRCRGIYISGEMFFNLMLLYLNVLRLF